MLSLVSFFLIYNLDANVYVIVIIIKPTCVGKYIYIYDITFKAAKKKKKSKIKQKYLDTFRKVLITNS